MDIKISTEQFNLFKSGEITSSFEMLDVNNDNTITKEDLSKAKDTKIKTEIQSLLNANEEDAELKTFSLDEINDLVNANNATKVSSNALTAEEAEIISQMTGLQDVDMTDLANKTDEELNAAINALAQNITLLNKTLKELNDEHANLETDKKDLEARKEALEKEKEAENQKLNEINDKLTNEKNILKLYQNEFEQVQEDLEMINNRIIIESELENQRYEKTMEELSNTAIANYDPNVHGEDFEAYFAKELSKTSYPIFNNVEKFDELAGILQDRTITALNNITEQSKIVIADMQTQQNIQAKIGEIDTNINQVSDTLNSTNDRLNIVADKINAVTKEVGNQETNRKTVQTEVDTRKAAEEEKKKKKKKSNGNANLNAMMLYYFLYG